MHAAILSLSLWGLWVVLAVAHAAPPSRQPQAVRLPSALRQQIEHLATADLHAGLALAQTWQQQGAELPDDLLKTMVTGAMQPGALWSATEAAIQGFALYNDRPWVSEVLAPFLAEHAAHILVNAPWFAALHRDWTTRAIDTVALQYPTLVLQELQHLATLDQAWAKTLADKVLTQAPALMFPHVERLLALDPHGTQGRLHAALHTSPHAVVRAVQSYIAAPWGPRLFAEAALADPRWTVSIAWAHLPESPAIAAALHQSPDPRLHLLVQLAQGAYPAEVKGRMAVFVQALVDHTLSLAEAMRLSQHEREYFEALGAMKVADPDQHSPALDYALSDEALGLSRQLNDLHEQPDHLRFRAISAFSAQALYLLVTYGEEEMFTSSYRGVFDRLLARMRAEGLTGDHLLARVRDVRLRALVQSATTFNRLEAFLATIPSAVARWSLIVRSMRDIDRAPDVVREGATAAEIVGAPLDVNSLRLIRDTLTQEYARAEQERNSEGMVIYGLLAARFADRHDTALAEPGFTAIARRYQASLPALHRLPTPALFTHSRQVQRHFFYDDDDAQTSFQSFLAHYHHAKGWRVVDHGPFVHLSADGAGKQIEIYANKPFHVQEGLTAIAAALQQRGLTPQVIVHRGHSYHADDTIKQIPATATLVFLGSCGGYLHLSAVLDKAPAAHVIATRGIAGVVVNDPLLKALNDYLLRGKELIWTEFWRTAEATLASKTRFAEYLPPDKNGRIIFLKAYRALTQDLTPPDHPSAHVATLQGGEPTSVVRR